MKTLLKLVSLATIAVFAVILVPPAAAGNVPYCRGFVAPSRPLSLYTLGTGLGRPVIRPAIPCYRPYVAPSRPLSLYTLGTGLAPRRIIVYGY